jgi:hypothetical protein
MPSLQAGHTRRQGTRDWTLRGVPRELLLVSLAALTYIGVRALTEGSVRTAVANGRWLLDAEHALGVAWEESVQAVVLPQDTLVSLANWIYIWGHWPVIAVVAVALYTHRRRSYLLLRNAIFISGAIGFLFFALLPVAPPRLLDAGLVDTVLERSTSYRAMQPPSLTNQYAAFPSLHFGWNLVVGIVLFRTYRSRLIRAFAVVMPAAMGFAVVATANHYVADIVAGGIIVLLGLIVASHFIPTLGATDVRDENEPAEPPRRASAVRRGAPRGQRPRSPARGRGARHLAGRG